MKIESLESTTVDQLHEAFCRAFADYFHPPPADRELFGRMLFRRGAAFNESIAAWDDGQIVGFVINAAQAETGQAYNVATAVDPRKRGLGLGKSLMTKAIERFKELKFREYRLEALVQNKAARSLYENVGFKPRREFVGVNLELESKTLPSRSELQFRKMQINDYAWAVDNLGYELAWQNALHCLHRVKGHQHGLVAEENGTRVGAGIMFPDGDVPFLVVHPSHRKQGVGTAMLGELVRTRHLQTAKFVNLVSGADGISWLQSLGGVIKWRQVEYIRELG